MGRSGSEIAVNRWEKIKALLEELLKERCPELEREEESDKVLFFCRGELYGSMAKLGEDRFAATVYSEKMSNPLHREFIRRAKEFLKGDVLEADTKLSSGVEQNFYYTYLHVKL